MLTFRAAARTDVGVERTSNEDAFLVRPDLGLWAVADGMGGHELGAHASRAVIEHLGAIEPPSEARLLLRAVGDSLTACHEQLADLTVGRRPPGSTVVALLIFECHFACVWAGDSRLYRRRDGRLELLTRDHSTARALEEQGLSDAALAAASLDNAGQITRAVGAGLELVLDVIQDSVRPGDIFLLCSDGLTGALDDAAIARLIRPGDPEAAAERLIAEALANAAADNVTLILVEAADIDPDATLPDPLAKGS